MASINELIAENLRAELGRRRISKQEFYVGTGIPERTGARRLAGTSPWSTDELAAAAAYLHVPVISLLQPSALADSSADATPTTKKEVA